MEFKLNNQATETVLARLSELGLVTPESEPHQRYTLEHKQAFLAVQLELLGKVTQSGLLHDTEKLVLYGLLPYKEAHNVHTQTSRHHIQNCLTDEDRMDCVIDYECARLTKPDKPLNAYNTIVKYFPDAMEVLNPLLKELGLDSPVNLDLDYTRWNSEMNKLTKIMAEQSAIAINSVYYNISRLGIERSVQKFYGV